jgi:hypothetical protein
VTPLIDESGLDLFDELLERPDLRRLAEAVCFASRVEPFLLRRARIDLVPEASVELEAELWFSPIVESRTVHGLVLKPEAARWLREGLVAHDRPRAERARRIIGEAHADAPATVQLFERLTWLFAISGSKAVAAAAPILDSALRAMLEQPGRELDLARWVVRALPALPQEIRESPSGWRLWLAATARLPSPAAASAEPPPGGATVLAELLPEDVGRVSVGARIVPSGIEFSEPPAEDAHVIDVPRSNPMLLDVGTGVRRRTIALAPGSRQVSTAGGAERVGERPGVSARLDTTSRVVKLQLGEGGKVLLVVEENGDFAICDSRTLASIERWSGGPGGRAAIHPSAPLIAATGASPPTLRSDGAYNVEVQWMPLEASAVEFAPSKSATVVYATPDGAIRLTNEQVLREEGPPVVGVAWDASGTRLAAIESRRILLFDTERLVREIQLDSDARALAFAPDGRRLVLAQDDGVRVLDLTGNEHGRAASPSVAVAWAPSGSVVAAVGRDGVTRAWDTSGGPYSLDIERPAPSPTVVYSPDGNALFLAATLDRASLETALGERFELSASDPKRVRERLKRELDALANLLQAIALDFHVGAQERDVSSADPGVAYGLGSVLDPRAFDAVRVAAEWAVASAWEAVQGNDRSDWRGWRGFMVRGGAKLSGQEDVMEAVTGFLEALGELLEFGRGAFDDDPYRSQYGIDDGHRRSLNGLGVRFEGERRERARSGADDGQLYLNGTYGDVVELFDTTSPMFLERLRRWQDLPELNIAWEERETTDEPSADPPESSTEFPS